MNEIAGWWVAKDIMVDERLAVFKCAGCRNVEMTAESMPWPEITSAWNRYRFLHKDCEKYIDD